MINPPGGRNPQEFGVANKGTTMISSDLEIALQTISKSSPGKFFCYFCVVSSAYEIRSKFQYV